MSPISLPRQPQFPFRIVGIAGFMRSGKDTVANELVRRYGFIKVRFAGILYRMWNVCQNTQGVDATDRRLKLMHDIISEFSSAVGSNISYQSLVYIVEEIVDEYEALLSQALAYPDQVPSLEYMQRWFLQNMGTEGEIAPLGDPNPLGEPGFGRIAIRSFAFYTARKLLMERVSEYQGLEYDNPSTEFPMPGVVFSDIRYPEEVQDVADWAGHTFFLQVPEDVLIERLQATGEDQLNAHATEQAAARILSEKSDIVTTVLPGTLEQPLSPEITEWMEESGCIPLEDLDYGMEEFGLRLEVEE